VSIALSLILSENGQDAVYFRLEGVCDMTPNMMWTKGERAQALSVHAIYPQYRLGGFFFFF